jgi:hypothetical protein
MAMKSVSGGKGSPGVAGGTRTSSVKVVPARRTAMTEAQKKAKAMAALEAKRAAVAKKTGVRPNYRTK